MARFNTRGAVRGLSPWLWQQIANALAILLILVATGCTLYVPR